jgi:hypothetical protein
MQNLYLSENNLTGTFPRAYGGMSYMKFLTIYHNPGLSGCLPSEWKGRDLTNGNRVTLTYSGKVTQMLTETNVTGFC